MSNLIQSITSMCHHVVNKIDNLRVETNKKYNAGYKTISKNVDTKQGLVLTTSSSDFYVNIKNNISLRLCKELNIDQMFNHIDTDVFKNLKQNMQIIDDNGWYHVAMQEGDIEINFNDSTISKKISEHEYMQKTGALIKGEDCFIQRSSPGGRDGDRYALIAATQEDLKAILMGLTELV